MGFVWTDPVGGASAKEINSTKLPRRRWPLRQHQQLQRTCASNRGEWCQPFADEHPTPPAGEDAGWGSAANSDF